MPAPLGNKNALKHGLYARRVTPAQQEILGQVQPLDVQHEISILRAVLDNILGEIEQAAEPSLKALLYNSLFSGVSSLNTTIRTHALLSGQDTDLERDIEAGKLFARQRLNVYAYLNPGSSSNRDTPETAQPPGKKGRRTSQRPK